MHRVLILVPFAFDEKGLANRRAQQEAVELGPDVQFDYRPVKAGPALYDTLIRQNAEAIVRCLSHSS